MKIENIDSLIEKYNSYNDSPNKRKSLELRDALNTIRKNAALIRQKLREADKDGY